MKNKWFTLMELLGVIVILAIIALITIPVTYNIIKTSREKAFVDTGYSIINAAKQTQTKNAGKNITLDLFINYTTKENIDKIELKGTLPDSGSFHIDENGKTELKLWSKKTNICITKSLEDKKIIINKELKQENCILISNGENNE